MDSKLFYQKLTELADWYIPKPVTLKNMRTDKDHVEEVWHYDAETGEEIVQELSIAKNDTLPIRIREFKTEVDCPDCGRKNAKDRIVNIRYNQYPEPHWARSCNLCKQHYNPLTEQFDCGLVKSGNNWVTYFRKDK